MRRQIGAAWVMMMLAGCTWSNSLYHARRLSKEALQLERTDRPFEAASVWSQAAVKADSAFARHPGGADGSEALWLRGRAQARSADCPGATVSLERAITTAPGATWREDAEFELARCLQRLGDRRARQHFERLLASADPTRRREAHLRVAQEQLASREWNAVLGTLAGIDTIPARLDRALALAGLGRPADVLIEVEPLLAARDSTVSWERLIEGVAAADGAAADTLLQRLVDRGLASGTRRGDLLFAAARGALAANAPGAADRLGRVIAADGSPTASASARLLVAATLYAGATSIAGLRVAVDSTRRLGSDDGAAALRFRELGRVGESLAAQQDSLVPGALDGDLLTFLHAETARDSLGAPRLAAAILIRLERDWPLSPYVPKALVARMVLQPDSVDALRDRVLAHIESPYVAFLLGREGPRFAELEQALALFAQARAARVPSPVRPRPAATPVGGVDQP